MDDEEAIPIQLDDLDGDGEWDELFALIDLSSVRQKPYLSSWGMECLYQNP